MFSRLATIMWYEKKHDYFFCRKLHHERWKVSLTVNIVTVTYSHTHRWPRPRRGWRRPGQVAGFSTGSVTGGVQVRQRFALFSTSEETLHTRSHWDAVKTGRRVLVWVQFVKLNLLVDKIGYWHRYGNQRAAFPGELFDTRTHFMSSAVCGVLGKKMKLQNWKQTKFQKLKSNKNHLSFQMVFTLIKKKQEVNKIIMHFGWDTCRRLPYTVQRG